MAAEGVKPGQLQEMGRLESAGGGWNPLDGPRRLSDGRGELS